MATDKDKLKAIAEILNSYESQIEEAVDNDCEVNIGGNGINCCEAHSTFKPLAKEIRAIISAK